MSEQQRETVSLDYQPITIEQVISLGEGVEGVSISTKTIQNHLHFLHHSIYHFLKSIQLILIFYLFYLLLFLLFLLLLLLLLIK